MPEKSPLIYERLAEVFGEIPAIEKSARNVDQGYAARSIDDVYNELHAIFAKHQVRPVPQIVNFAYEWLEARSGSRLCHVFATLDLYFETTDGSRTEKAIRVVSEGRDASDKAANKALSGAMKYALLSAFLIPVEIVDADLSTLEATTPSAPVETSRPDPHLQIVNTAKAEILAAANGEKSLAAQAWADGLATRGIVDEASIELAMLPAIVVQAKGFVEESRKVTKETPSG